MKDLSNNAVITKSKAIFGHFLKTEDYERMLKIRSLPDLVSYLKKISKLSDNFEWCPRIFYSSWTTRIINPKK